MRTQLILILLLGLSSVAGAQHHHHAASAPLAGTVPELPPVGLPLPSIGLPHPPTGLPPLAAPGTPGGVRHIRPAATGRYASRRLSSPVYIVPAFVGPVGAYALDVSGASDPAPVGGGLRVEVPPGVYGQVYFDGYYVGTTEDLDRPVEIASGRHSIEIRADGYQPAQDDIAVAPGRSVTYRGLLTQVPVPPAASATPVAESARAKTFYVIPGCYVGDVQPEESTVPAGCDPHRAIAVRR